MARRRRAKEITGADALAWRTELRQNQAEFWGPIGVTQSGGSRYEAGRRISTPVALLLWALRTGKLSESELQDGLRAIGRGE